MIIFFLVPFYFLLPSKLTLIWTSRYRWLSSQESILHPSFHAIPTTVLCSNSIQWNVRLLDSDVCMLEGGFFSPKGRKGNSWSDLCTHPIQYEHKSAGNVSLWGWGGGTLNLAVLLQFGPDTNQFTSGNLVQNFRFWQIPNSKPN